MAPKFDGNLFISLGFETLLDTRLTVFRRFIGMMTLKPCQYFKLFLLVTSLTCQLVLSRNYFRLAIQWPPTMDRFHPRVEKMRQEQEYIFTIHGLWPESNGRPLQYCQSNFSIDSGAFSNAQLPNYWASFGRMNNHAFWTHEWNAHGTCASAVMNHDVDPRQYFQLALKAYMTFGQPLGMNLASYGIRPDNSRSYSQHEMKKALTSILQQEPTLVCSGEKLQEIRFCLNSSLKPTDCDFVENRCYSKIILPV